MRFISTNTARQVMSTQDMGAFYDADDSSHGASTNSPLRGAGFGHQAMATPWRQLYAAD